MGNEFDPDQFPLDVERLIDDAVGAALRLKDADHFLRWMRENIHRYGRHRLEITKPDLFSVNLGPGIGEIEAELSALAMVLGRQLWNALPLPSNHFRPKPLPHPGRNDPCFCGSGRKFKHCCAHLPEMPALDPDEIWPILIDHLSDTERQSAVASGRIPVEALGGMAYEYLEEENAPKKAVRLLEPLFEGKPFRGTDERYDWLLNILCDVYDRLGYRRKKEDLLHRIITEAPRSPLRSGAWQRLAAIRMDAGDPTAAWDAFTKAQRDEPGSPSLGMLEIQLLLSQQRTDEARRRARFWLGKLSRLDGIDDQYLAFFEAVSEDPHRAMLGMITDITDGAGEYLQRLIPDMKTRQLPEYEAIPMDEWMPEQDDDSDRIGAHLRSLGLEDEQVAEALDDLKQQIVGDWQDDEQTEDEPRFTGTSMLFRPPKGLSALEREWHEDVCSLDKPFSVHDQLYGVDDGPWNPEEEEVWSDWLAAHPRAWDSLDILDDVAAALMVHPQFGTPWFNAEVLAPVLDRAVAIVERALSGHPDAMLEWAHLENRPALRALSRRLGMALGAGDYGEGQRIAERMLALNPNDNHGVRALVIGGYLAEDRNEDAVVLADRYPGDMQVDLPYGKALALFRLGRLEEAEMALHEAIDRMPKVAKMLIAKSPRRPKQDRYGVTAGGDEEAWLYREAALDLWRATPGALDWLKRTSKRRG